MSATLRENRPSVATDIASRRVAASNAAAESFFTASAESIARACQAMAARFQDGARLLVYGGVAQRSDVAHVVVEFLHPVIVGKRALPALAVDSSRLLSTLGRDTDILMILDSAHPREAEVVTDGRRRGMLTLWLTGQAPRGSADFHFAVPSYDACIVQETHEMLYHVLWELVHVFFDHGSQPRDPSLRSG